MQYLTLGLLSKMPIQLDYRPPTGCLVIMRRRIFMTPLHHCGKYHSLLSVCNPTAL